MQRCPQCEFIYEDDQSRCDMDGAALVHDSNPLPRLQALAVTTASEATAKSAWRRVVPFAAALVLTVVMALVYYVSVSRSSRVTSTTGITTVETPATISEPSPATATSSIPASQETEKSNDDAASTKETAPVGDAESKKAEPPSAKKPANDRTTKSTPRAPSNNQPRATTEPEKESKVSSALKKTKRFFKKVF